MTQLRVVLIVPALITVCSLIALSLMPHSFTFRLFAVIQSYNGGNHYALENDTNAKQAVIDLIPKVDMPKMLPWLLSGAQLPQKSHSDDESIQHNKANVTAPHSLSDIPNHLARHSADMEARVLQLTNDVAEFFNAKMKSLMECQYKGQCPIRTIIYDYSDPGRAYGGMADRLRGVVGTMYVAMASGRLLQLKWNLPGRLDELFEGAIFNIDDYEAFLAKNSGKFNTSDNFNRLGEKEARLFLDSPTNVIHMNQHAIFYIRAIYNDEELQQGLRPIFWLFEQYGLQFSYELATFVGLRVLFKSPKQSMKEMTEKLWKQQGECTKCDGCRIGVQIRMAPPEMSFHRDADYPRLTKAQIAKCFLPKTVELAGKCTNRSMTPLVYISSDSAVEKKNFKNSLLNLGIKSFYSDFEPFHIDESVSGQPAGYGLNKTRETLAEWFVLGRMEQLIISRSGFAELASTYGSFLASRQPTIRLPHGYNENCNFENDYYLKTVDLENYAPPNGR